MSLQVALFWCAIRMEGFPILKYPHVSLRSINHICFKHTIPKIDHRAILAFVLEEHGIKQILRLCNLHYASTVSSSSSVSSTNAATSRDRLLRCRVTVAIVTGRCCHNAQCWLVHASTCSRQVPGTALS